MGWSCAAKASYVEKAINELIRANTGSTSSNVTLDGGFYEISRKEHADGAITGTVWRPLTAAEKVKWSDLSDVDSRVAKRGSFKITGDGKIARFPGLPADIKAAAEAKGAAEYSRVYES